MNAVKTSCTYTDVVAVLPSVAAVLTLIEDFGKESHAIQTASRISRNDSERVLLQPSMC